ncbi:hypothetical protein Tco_0600914 [Tanacetum coccineum]
MKAFSFPDENGIRLNASTPEIANAQAFIHPRKFTRNQELAGVPSFLNWSVIGFDLPRLERVPVLCETRRRALGPLSPRVLVITTEEVELEELELEQKLGSLVIRAMLERQYLSSATSDKQAGWKSSSLYLGRTTAFARV